MYVKVVAWGEWVVWQGLLGNLLIEEGSIGAFMLKLGIFNVRGCHERHKELNRN